MLYRDKKTGSLKHEKAKPTCEPVLCEKCSQGFLKPVIQIHLGKAYETRAPGVPLYRNGADENGNAEYVCKSCYK